MRERKREHESERKREHERERDRRRTIISTSIIGNDLSRNKKEKWRKK